ncbi:winged helix family transcriptional regulator [Halobacteriovorax vibrionivorans]|uniref:Winged helix family transcriptional regulator n=2 Tax=Halobacteriovorax TaxID=1652133 RepID=A0ABY0IIP3_9BACT|nr:winged helix family transcriptional regulator [Halobacteriovorax vibrionivorans]TGD47673.1 winged helix family transcriptional regulator [Halobacteriovorax sp. Y22]
MNMEPLNNSNNQTLSFRNLSLDPKNRVAYVDERKVELTKTECKILFFLLDGGKRVYPREQLVKFIWGDVDVANKTVNTHLTHLRHKTKGVDFRIRINRNNQICLHDL